MRTLSVAFVLLLSSVAQAQTVSPSTSFTLGAVTADCIPVLSQDTAATPPGIPSGSGPAVCPGGFSGGGDYEIYLLNDPGQSGSQLTLYGCQPNWGPLVPASPQTNPPTATVTTTLTGCSNGTETYSGTVVDNYTQKKVRCRLGYCPTWVSTRGNGTLTLSAQ